MKRVTAEAVRRAWPEEVAPWVEALCEAGDALEIGLHLVGGPVRDFLLDRGVRDIDLIAEARGGEGGVTDKSTAETVARKAALPGVRIVVHRRFGTVRLQKGGVSVDVASVRSETYASPGALPTVEAGQLEQDLTRRDFTVNALALPLNAVASRGRSALIDPGRGLDDLRDGVLRVFHPRSFHDDPTRALRAARFAARLGFGLARGSRNTLRAALRDGAFGAVTGERYRAELEKLFLDPRHGLDPARAIRFLHETHVLAALEPGLGLPPTARGPLRRLGRDLGDDALGLAAEAPWIAGLRLWLAPLDVALRRRVLRRFAVRGAAARAINGHAKEAERVLARLARARGRGSVDALVRELPDETLLALAAEAPTPLRRRLLRWVGEDRRVQLPISGRDLVELGLEGPAVGRALARIRVGVLDGDIKDRDEALALAREVGARSSGKRARGPGSRSGPARGRGGG